MVNAYGTDTSLLYYINEVPYSKGGLAAFNIHYIPPEGWDQTTRIWFQEAKSANGKIIVTEPYVDTMSGDPVKICDKERTVCWMRRS